MTNKLIIAAAALVAACLSMTPTHTIASEASRSTMVRSGYVEPLTPENSFLVLVDLQDMFGLTIGSIDQTALVNNAVGVAKAAKVFNVPTVLATANARTFAGPFFAQVTEARKDLPVYDRTAINLWDDSRVVDEIRRSGRKKIVIGGCGRPTVSCCPRFRRSRRATKSTS
jgi:hypothetical protein